MTVKEFLLAVHQKYNAHLITLTCTRDPYKPIDKETKRQQKIVELIENKLGYKPDTYLWWNLP